MLTDETETDIYRLEETDVDRWYRDRWDRDGCL